MKSIFGPLNLFNFRYIKGGVRGNNNIGIKKCTTIFLRVLNFGQVGEIFKNFKQHPLGALSYTHHTLPKNREV